MSELKTLFAIETEKEVAGKKIKISTFELNDVAILLDKFSPVFDKLLSSKKSQINTTEILLSILKEKGLLNIILDMTTDLSSEEIGKLNLAAASEILKYSIEENIDFFTQSVAPKLEELSGIVRKAGSTESKS